MFSPLFFSIFSPPNPLPSKYLSASLLITAPGADPGSAGALTSQLPSGDERLVKRGFKRSLEELLPDAAVSDNGLGAALPGNRGFLEAGMQIERINVRSPCESGPAQLWAPLHWRSRGQRAQAQTFVKDKLSSAVTLPNPLKIFNFFHTN